MKIAQAQDAWSFERIYEVYRVPISTYIRCRVEDPELAADLTQVFFLKVFLALESLDAARGISAWLFRITQNIVNDELRRRRRAFAQRPLWGAGVNLEDLQEADMLEEIQRHELVSATLEQLPKASQVVILLRFYRGLSMREIAQELSIKEGAAKARISRARRLFRECYQAFEQGAPHIRRRIARRAWCA